MSRLEVAIEKIQEAEGWIFELWEGHTLDCEEEGLSDQCPVCLCKEARELLTGLPD